MIINLIVSVIVLFSFIGITITMANKMIDRMEDQTMSMQLDFDVQSINMAEAQFKPGPDGQTRIHIGITIDDPKALLDAIEFQPGGNKAINEWMTENYGI